MRALGFGPGAPLVTDQPTGRLQYFCLEAAAGDDEVVLVHADTYGGAVAHANIDECRGWSRGGPLGTTLIRPV